MTDQEYLWLKMIWGNLLLWTPAMPGQLTTISRDHSVPTISNGVTAAFAAERRHCIGAVRANGKTK